jgi:MFS family permease
MDAADETANNTSVRPIVLLSMAGFCAMAVLRVSEPILPEVAHEFGTTVGIASIMATAFALAYGVCQVFSGPFGDRYGKFLIITVAPSPPRRSWSPQRPGPTP